MAMKYSRLVHFKKLRPDAIVPSKNHDAAGFDLHVVEVERMSCTSPGEVDALMHPDSGGYINIEPLKMYRGKTGIAFQPPKGYFGLVDARSGMASKYGLNNPCGTIDADYRGDIMVCFFTIYPLRLKMGDRIAHMMILPYEEKRVDPITGDTSYIDFVADEVEELDDTSRGDQGFGSSGR